MSEGTQRRLAAIVSADVVGYWCLMAADVTGTLTAIQAHRKELWNPTIKKWLISCFIVLGFCCASFVWSEVTAAENRQMSNERTSISAFFPSPKQAVEAISKMLREEDWATLARYYELEGSGIDRSNLIAGDFFIRSKRPETAHPGGFWRYKHPFPPQFEYAFATPEDSDGIVTVRVSIKIDQGAGQPAQEGWKEFRMRKSVRGYQILPK